MSRRGVVCPRCGTSTRAYCRKCNEPLTPAARKEVERAMKDPVYLKAAELAVRMAELQQQIDDTPEGGLIDLGGDETAKPKPRGLPGAPSRHTQAQGDAGRRNQEAPHTADDACGSPPDSRPHRNGPGRSGSRRPNSGGIRKDEGRAELHARAHGASRRLHAPGAAQLLPARKIAVIQKVRSNNPVAWVCNYCGCWHNQPSECCEPWGEEHGYMKNRQ